MALYKFRIIIIKYYSDIVSPINESSRNCIPGRRFNSNISEYVIPVPG